MGGWGLTPLPPLFPLFTTHRPFETPSGRGKSSRARSVHSFARPVGRSFDILAKRAQESELGFGIVLSDLQHVWYAHSARALWVGIRQLL